MTPSLQRRLQRWSRLLASCFRSRAAAEADMSFCIWKCRICVQDSDALAWLVSDTAMAGRVALFRGAKWRCSSSEAVPFEPRRYLIGGTGRIGGDGCAGTHGRTCERLAICCTLLQHVAALGTTNVRLHCLLPAQAHSRHNLTPNNRSACYSLWSAWTRQLLHN